MLNLTFTMKTLLGVFFLIAGLLMPVSTSHLAVAERPKIDSPVAGQALQGVVTISGSTNVYNFLSSEVAFSYSDDPTGTWFLLATNQEAVKDAALATWDTTTIADGMYRLRVLVTLVDGKTVEAVVEDLRVRNYTPIETNTPAPTEQAATTAMPTTLMIDTPVQPAPSIMPVNPAEITPDKLGSSLTTGVVLVVSLFSLGLIYLFMRKSRRRN